MSMVHTSFERPMCALSNDTYEAISLYMIVSIYSLKVEVSGIKDSTFRQKSKNSKNQKKKTKIKKKI